MVDFSSFKLFLDKNGISYLEYEPMREHTSFKIGGPARFFVMPDDADELSRVLSTVKETGLEHYILGKGTNVLFDDEGYNGAVISTLSLDKIEIDGGSVTAGAGVSVTALSRSAMESGLSGLEFAYGIPGSVGGAVFMNAGAYDGEVSFVLEESRYIDTRDLSVHTLDAADHDFSYRHSSYKDHPERIIIEARFDLARKDRDTIKAKMDDFMDRRRTKQPLEYPSAGSVFKRYPGRYTAQMIDEARLKGASVGGAAVSEKHAGFIINKGGATCQDVLTLVDMIKSRIRETFGIEIECEIIHVGKGGAPYGK